MMKFGNLNIREGLKKRIAAFALAGSMAVTMCGCVSKESAPSVQVPTSATIEGTLDSVSKLTAMDEFLATAETTQGYNFYKVLEMYNNARINKDLPACNNYLYSIGRLLLMAQVAEQVGVKFEDIEDFVIDSESVTITYKIRWTETVSGGIEVEQEDTITKTFELEGEIRNTIANIDNADKNILRFDTNDFQDVDMVYSAYIKRTLLSSSEIEVDTPGFLGTLLFNEPTVYTINNQLNQEKIDAFKTNNSEPRTSSQKYGYNYNGEDRGISLCDAIREQKQEQSLNIAKKAIGLYSAKRLHR